MTVSGRKVRRTAMTTPVTATAASIASIATGDIASEDAIVSVRGLTKRYGKHTAVDRISFDIRRGEIFGMLGPNGAGKTTTLEILEGIRTQDAGEVRIVGLDIRRNRREVQRRVGVQLQATTLFPELTARETLALFGSFYPHALSPDTLLREVALDEKAKSFPQDLSRGSGSGLRWHSRWSTIRSCSFWTSRRPGWTRRAGACCGIPCCGCASAARPFC